MHGVREGTLVSSWRYGPLAPAALDRATLNGATVKQLAPALAKSGEIEGVVKSRIEEMTEVADEMGVAFCSGRLSAVPDS